MSQNTNLPIRLQAELIPAKWTLVRGFADRWEVSVGRIGVRVTIPAIQGFSKLSRNEFFPLDHLSSRWTSRLTEEKRRILVEDASKPGLLSFDDLSSRWASRFTEQKRRILERNKITAIDNGRAEAIDLLLCLREQSNCARRVRDLRSLREDFFDLTRETSDLIGFLNRCGMWRLHFSTLGGWSSVLRTKTNPWISTDVDKPMDLQIVTPESIWRDGERVREWMRTGLKSLSQWFTSGNKLVLRPVSKFPFYAYTLQSAGDAIEASVLFDLLQGAQFALCARADCSKPFELTRRAKQYCSHDCAHLEVVRRSRRPRTRRREK